MSRTINRLIGPIYWAYGFVMILDVIFHELITHHRLTVEDRPFSTKFVCECGKEWVK